MTHQNISTDDIPTDAGLQRLWNIGRRVPDILFNEEPKLDDIFGTEQQVNKIEKYITCNWT